MYIASKYKKRWPTSFIVGEIQVKTTQIALRTFRTTYICFHSN